MTRSIHVHMGALPPSDLKATGLAPSLSLAVCHGVKLGFTTQTQHLVHFNYPTKECSIFSY